MSRMLDMASLDQVIAGFDISEILPDDYAAYRPMVRESLEYFVSQLSAARAMDLLQRQLALPPDADTRERLITVMRACPTLHKLGQVVARYEHLDKGFREYLQQLEMFETSYEPEQVVELVRREMGEAMDRYGVQLEPEEAIEGSVALVVPAWWRRPGRKRLHRAVIKIVKPECADRLDEELEVFDRLADFVDEARKRHAIPNFPYRETFKSVRNLLSEEVRLDHEQQHLMAARRFYAETPSVVIPRKLPFSTPRLTAMEMIDGVKVTELGRNRDRATAPLRRKIANTIIKRLITDIIFCRDKTAVFHADPHAGNLFATNNGNLAVLDWSLVSTLSKREREILVSMFIGAMTLSSWQIRRAVRSLAVFIEDEQRVNRVIQRTLKRIRRGQLPNPIWFTDFIEELAQNGVHFPPNLILFRKSVFTLKGVLADIDPHVSMDNIFFTTVFGKLVSELPRRYVTWPRSRDFSTHLSNLDLWMLYFSLPLTLAKYVHQSFKNPPLPV